MSTNKSTEESLGLVPAMENAAFDWQQRLTSSQFITYVAKYHPRYPNGKILTPSESVNIWMQEVVLKWYHGNLTSRFNLAKKYCHLYDFSVGLSNEHIAEIYLKEHSVKEEPSTKSDLREKALAWWNDQSMEYKDSIDWPQVMGLDYGHCIEVLFSKEGTKS